MKCKHKKTGNIIEVSSEHWEDVLQPQGAYEEYKAAPAKKAPSVKKAAPKKRGRPRKEN